jgi:hypothetical protein
MTISTYPVNVNAHLDARLNRWLWLVKWLLAVPHYVILAFLWLGFVVLSVVAFFAILFTGRYPRALFDFNVGVLRWSWRVAYYTYGALGTDRYPPFSLQDVPDYPAHLQIDYPEHLSRGLVLVKWWLLAIPHYLIVGIFVGGGLYAANEAARSDQAPWLWGSGLIGLLVLVAAIVLLFTGRYPRSIFDLVLGMNRWVLRVAAYAGLMTDQYPPFRLDQGADEPRAGQLAMPSAHQERGADALASVEPTQPTQPVQVRDVNQSGPEWTPGRVVAVVLGSLAALVSLGVGLAGTTLAVADAKVRDQAGFLMSGQRIFATDTYAISSDNFELQADRPAAYIPRFFLGEAKITATSTNDKPVFLGVAATRDATSYLDGVGHATLIDPGNPNRAGSGPVYRTTAGGAPDAEPGALDIWAARTSSGVGTQSLVWPVENGDWTVVVMNADGSAGLSANLAAGATVPGLVWVVGILLSIAVTGLVVAVVLLVIGLRPGRTSPAAPPPASIA